MQGSEFDERSFFRAIGASGAQALIRTKRWAMRQKDIADIQLLEGLRGSDKEGSS